MSRRYTQASQTVDKSKKFNLLDAAAAVKKAATAKFDETVEIHVHLGVDPKKSDQNVRGTIALPHGIGKTKKIVVIAKGDKVKEALAAGADEAGDADIIEKISKGWLGFDSLVATPDAMKDLTKLAKTLGPKGLMPNPKAGTVTFDVARTVKELKAGRVEFKMDAYAIIHSIVGKASFPEKNLAENARVFLSAILAAKPSTAKGVYMKSISLASTMGPGVQVSPDSIEA